MIVSSRTPEGYPSRCSLCGAETNLEYSEPAGDAPCPSCGHLLWHSAAVLNTVQKIIAEQLGVNPALVTVDTPLVNDLGADSLDAVELVMELEEEFDLEIDDETAERIRTVGDFVRAIDKRKQRPTRP